MRTDCRYGRAATALLAGAMLMVLGGGPKFAAAGELRKYQTRYYDLHTDLDLDGVRETVVRVTAMAEEYYQRTKGFSGKVTQRLPFYLFTNPMEYYAAGGMPGSAGVFMSRGRDGKLMAITDERPTDRTWHVVQHEGFHQFVHSVIRGDIPVWVNEGLAEYFGEGLYTGDGYVVGIVPPYRLARLKSEIASGDQKSIAEMMAMSQKEWNGEMAMSNYNQGWSMIHFLVHGNDGKYVKALNGFLNDISNRRMRYENAWVNNFGRDIKGFEKCYRDHWLAQPPDCAADVYKQAVVATMTSYYARAYIQKGMKVPYETPEAFFATAEAGELKNDPKDWLPPSLLADNLPKVKGLGTWGIEQPKEKGGIPRLTCTIAQGKTFVGQFWIDGGKVAKVKVAFAGAEEAEAPSDGEPAGNPTTEPATTDPPPTSAPAKPDPPTATTAPTTAEAKPDPPVADDPVRVAIGLAKSYHAMGRDDKARALLTEALKKDPNSPLAAEAKRLLSDLK